MGAVATFLGVTALSPLAVGVVTGFLGWPLRKFTGVAGAMAQRNAARNPRRTATTAAALMVGLTLVTTALFVGASVKSAIGSTFERSVTADRFVTDDWTPPSSPPRWPASCAVPAPSSPPTGSRRSTSAWTVTSRGRGFEFEQIGALLDVDLTAGRFDHKAVDPVVVSTDGRARSASRSATDCRSSSPTDPVSMPPSSACSPTRRC